MEIWSARPLEDVYVHKDSNKPVELRAHAYTQGNQIHLGPGQEEQLPPELGHVVQQKRERYNQPYQTRYM